MKAIYNTAARLVLGLVLGAALTVTTALHADEKGAEAEASAPGCAQITFEDARYTVCRFDAAKHDMRLFLKAKGWAPWGLPVHGRFDAIETHLAETGEKLLFAMNAGMYHRSREAVGLYIEEGVQSAPLITGDGPGNFHLLPNGVFHWGDGEAHVTETSAYASANLSPRFATQSGPMLVIDGELHPRFIDGGSSRKMRNGVGVLEDQRTVIFAITEEPVNFHSFGRLFRDVLKTPNALFLDGGRATQLYSPELGRNDDHERMGPIVGVVVPLAEAETAATDQASVMDASSSSER